MVTEKDIQVRRNWAASGSYLNAKFPPPGLSFLQRAGLPVHEAWRVCMNPAYCWVRLITAKLIFHQLWITNDESLVKEALDGFECPNTTLDMQSTGITLCMALSQWEVMLHCNVIPHWLGTCTKIICESNLFIAPSFFSKILTTDTP